MRLKKIPKSRAKTAWGLCLGVIKAITEEPKRIRMPLLCAPMHPTEGGPACGTVGCFAGWVQILAGKKSIEKINWIMESKDILGQGLNYYTVGESEFPRFVFNLGEGDDCNRTNPGTRAHSRAVVRRIRNFMRINEAGLKAKHL